MQISLLHFVDLQDIARSLADASTPLDRAAIAARLQGVLDKAGPDHTVRIGLNEPVRMRLNDHGRALHAQNWAELRKGHENVIRETPQPEPDADGVSTWSMWELMQVFGPHIWHGSQLPFEDNLLVFEPNAELNLHQETPSTEEEGAAPRM